MKNKQRLRELAEKHGVKLTKRVFFDAYDDSRQKQTRFMDVPRPADEIHEELVEKGVIMQ